jgi:hypothetical protein
MLEKDIFTTNPIIARLTEDKAAFIALFTYFVALHSIGKFSHSFQSSLVLMMRKMSVRKVISINVHLIC